MRGRSNRAPKKGSVGPVVVAAVAGAFTAVAAIFSVLDWLTPRLGSFLALLVVVFVGLAVAILTFFLVRGTPKQQVPRPRPQFVQVWGERPITRQHDYPLKPGEKWRVEHVLQAGTGIRIKVRATDTVTLTIVPVLMSYTMEDHDGYPMGHPITGKKFEHEFVLGLGERLAFEVYAASQATFTLEIWRSYSQPAPKPGSQIR